jgi:hypothetical protein
MFRFLLNSAASPDTAIAEELFETLPLGVTLQDTEGRILAANAAAVRDPSGVLRFEAGFGWSSEELALRIPGGKDESQAGYTLHTNDVVVSDFALETRSHTYWLVKQRARSGISAPCRTRRAGARTRGGSSW